MLLTSPDVASSGSPDYIQSLSRGLPADTTRRRVCVLTDEDAGLEEHDEEKARQERTEAFDCKLILSACLSVRLHGRVGGLPSVRPVVLQRSLPAVKIDVGASSPRSRLPTGWRF
jgi:hypothetical protein